jgi:hypothetical protein
MQREQKHNAGACIRRTRVPPSNYICNYFNLMLKKARFEGRSTKGSRQHAEPTVALEDPAVFDKDLRNSIPGA